MTLNKSGGVAIELNVREALAKIAFLGIANKNDTNFDISGFLGLCKQVSPDYLVKLALVSREFGQMKDLPILILAYLTTTTYDISFLTSKILGDFKSLGRYVSYMRDGTVRKSLGSKAKRIVNNFLTSKTEEELFWGSVGNQPSLKDIIKLSHPKPRSDRQQAMFSYLLNKTECELLPDVVKAYEAFLKGETEELPRAPIQKLLTLAKTDAQWLELARIMSWNQIRMNLNNLAKHNVFDNEEVTEYIINILSNFEKIPKTLWAFSIIQTISNLDAKVPNKIRDILEQINFHLLRNTPKLDGDTILFVDASGSMGQPLATSFTSANKLTYSKIAAYFAAALISGADGNIRAIPFKETLTLEQEAKLGESFEVLYKRFSLNGGGTNISSTISYLLAKGIKTDNVIIISDNESWLDRSYFTDRQGKYLPTTSVLWKQYLEKNPNAKLILWDIQPSSNTQVQTNSRENTYLVSGYSDTVFKLISFYTTGESTNSLSELVEAFKI